MRAKRHLSIVGTPDPGSGVDRTQPQSVRPRIILYGASPPHADWVPTLLASHLYSVELRAAWEHMSLLESSRLPTVALISVDMQTVDRVADLLRSIDAAIQPHLLALCSDMRLAAVDKLIAAGVGDFVCLPSAKVELLPRVALRLRAIDRTAARPIDERAGRWPALDPFAGTLTFRKRTVRLTEREYRLFEVLRSAFGSVVHRRVLIAEIWGDRASDSNILEVYVRYLRVKLQHVAPSLSIETVRGVGYALREDAPERP